MSLLICIYFSDCNTLVLVHILKARNAAPVRGIKTLELTVFYI